MENCGKRKSKAKKKKNKIKTRYQRLITALNLIESVFFFIFWFKINSYHDLHLKLILPIIFQFLKNKVNLDLPTLQFCKKKNNKNNPP